METDNIVVLKNVFNHFEHPFFTVNFDSAEKLCETAQLSFEMAQTFLKTAQATSGKHPNERKQVQFSST
jgi:hypothetical protein